MPIEEMSDYRELLRLVTEPVDWRGFDRGLAAVARHRQAGDTRLLLRERVGRTCCLWGAPPAVIRL
ncbi:MAG: hypothetical protein OXE50_14650 [Chloroflexi bacterium]|nr:hypothetical protein [Chloroflexota bacterium]